MSPRVAEFLLLAMVAASTQARPRVRVGARRTARLFLGLVRRIAARARPRGAPLRARWRLLMHTCNARFSQVKDGRFFSQHHHRRAELVS
jgi:hypothetical protein